MMYLYISSLVNGEWNAYEEEERKRGRPSVRSKMEYLLLDYKRQGGGEQMQGAGGKVEESMQDICRRGKGE